MAPPSQPAPGVFAAGAIRPVPRLCHRGRGRARRRRSCSRSSTFNPPAFAALRAARRRTHRAGLELGCAGSARRHRRDPVGDRRAFRRRAARMRALKQANSPTMQPLLRARARSPRKTVGCDAAARCASRRSRPIVDRAAGQFDRREHAALSRRSTPGDCKASTPGMPVRGPDGLIGRVLEAGPEHRARPAADRSRKHRARAPHARRPAGLRDGPRRRAARRQADRARQRRSAPATCSSLRAPGGIFPPNIPVAQSAEPQPRHRAWRSRSRSPTRSISRWSSAPSCRACRPPAAEKQP